jgi:hypothetical protein
MSTQLSAGEAIRAFRLAQQPEMTLEMLADRVKKLVRKRPSTAKLSRIENGLQPVSTDILKPLAKITGIPAKELRPDLAELVGMDAA